MKARRLFYSLAAWIDAHLSRPPARIAAALIFAATACWRWQHDRPLGIAVFIASVLIATRTPLVPKRTQQPGIGEDPASLFAGNARQILADLESQAGKLPPELVERYAAVVAAIRAEAMQARGSEL